MAFVSDFTKAPEQIVLDQINNDNSSSLTLTQVSFGLPTASTGTSPARDTTLTVNSVADEGYSGSVVVMYNRVDISTVPGTRSTVFPKGSSVNISDLIPQINAAYQINLTSADYTDGPLPTFTGTPNEEHTFQLVINADSLPFENSVTLTVKANDIPLSSVITTTTLNGLVYTQPSS
jgi:hypothetical protein